MRRSAVVASLVLVLAAPSRASVVVALSIEEMARRADLVVLGQVISLQTRWASDHRHIYRTVVVRAEESWKGTVVPGADVAIVVPGGELEGVSEQVIGEPTFVEGARGAFFLEPAGHTHRLIGLSQGFFESAPEGLVQHTQDLALAHRTVGGATTISPHGAEANPPMTIEALRTRVRGALGNRAAVAPGSP